MPYRWMSRLIGSSEASLSLVNGVLNSLGRRSKSLHVTAVVVAVFGIGLLDYLTGPEVSLSIFYILPVSMAVWFVGPKFGEFVSVFGAVCWLAADLASGMRYAHPATPYWNSLVRMGMLLITSSLFSKLKSSQAGLEQTVDQRTAALHAEIARREELERELIEAADRERERIGRDLHDGLGQHLAAAAAVSLSLEQLLAGRQTENAEAKKITQMVKQAISESRLLAKGLYPAALELGGLSVALEQLCSGVRVAYGIDCRLISEGSVVIQDRRVAEQLFRIAQEAVNNALKHAKPQHLVVGLTVTDKATVLIIKDDGHGESQPLSSDGGMGLHIMACRVKMIGGSLDIEPDPQGGTLITCRLEQRAGWRASNEEEVDYDASFQI